MGMSWQAQEALLATAVAGTLYEGGKVATDVLGDILRGGSHEEQDTPKRAPSIPVPPRAPSAQGEK